MVTKAISNGFSSPYQPIPGKSLQNKASLVENQAFQTLPWVDVSFILYKQVSTGLQHSCFHLPKTSNLLDLSQPLPKIACGTEIVHVNKGKGFSKKLIKASTQLQQLYFFLLTHSTVAFAYDFFKNMLPHTSDENSKKTSPDTAESRPTSFTLGLMGIGLALQFRYAPTSTLAGVTVGAFLREHRDSLNAEEAVSWMPKEIAEAAYPRIKKFIKSIQSNNMFNNPKSTAQKCYHVWLDWSFLSRSISSSRQAFSGGVKRGVALEAYFRSYLPEK